MKRRTLSSITDYHPPKTIFSLITKKDWDYGDLNRDFYTCRDRAFMAMTFCSAGRVTAVCGGHKYKGDWKRETLQIVGKYTGIVRENFDVTDKFLMVKGMKVIKRTDKTIEKHGEQVTLRDPFSIPLKRDLYENEYWDQLVPFGWLIAEYLTNYNLEGRVFKFKRGRAWQIINHVTGMFPHWVRAQSEHFYVNYLLHDSIKLAKFVKVNPSQTAAYISYDWAEQLKDQERVMDFKWIRKSVKSIKKRMKERNN